ncbi:glyoxalase/bleomycin resistance/extradiol dioxygenase family protein [Aurantimonas sp. A2-1-M11]|uniref:VOC family protein n=1 Tax=Aurantimonas sp. A2-1-M11 TaxID=3113712 RepID=UPI002F95F4FC
MSEANPMQGVIPYLAMAGRAGEACEFYAQAFGATEMGRMPVPDDETRLMHAQVKINDGCLMMTDHGGEAATPSTSFGHLQLVVGDGRAWWDRALAAGCQVLAPYERQFWGDDWGLLQDPFGLRWAILQTGSQD